MSISGSIHIALPTGGESFSISSHTSAKEDVRFTFNPSQSPDVTQLKALGVLWLSKIEEIRTKTVDPEARRLLATARTNFQTASMWGVLGATHSSIAKDTK